MNPTSFPELFEPSRDLRNLQKSKFLGVNIFRKIGKNPFKVLYITFYAQNLILVNLILVNFFTFLVITRSQGLRIGRILVQIDPTGPPDLFQQPRTLYNSQKVEILRS